METVDGSGAAVVVGPSGEAALVLETKGGGRVGLPWSALRDVELVEALAAGRRWPLGPRRGVEIAKEVGVPGSPVEVREERARLGKTRRVAEVS